MNQRFRVLRDLGEQLELAARTDSSHREMGPGRERTRGTPFQRVSRPGLVLAGVLAIAAVALTVGLVLGARSSRAEIGGTARAQEAAFVSEFPVLSLPQSPAARAHADSGPADTLNEEKGLYPVLDSPQSDATRAGGRGIAGALDARLGFGVGGSSGSQHYAVRFVGRAKYQNVPSLTREVTVHGVQVWFFVVYLPVTRALPRAIVTGNDPQQAHQFITRRGLAMVRHAANEFAGYQLYARVGIHGRPQLVFSPVRGPANRTRTERRRFPPARFLSARQIANATLSGPHGTIVAVVPGGVSRLSWSWPREFDSSALRFVPALTRSAEVFDDVAVAGAPARFSTAEEILPQTVAYYDAADRELDRYGDLNHNAADYLTTTWDGSTPGLETRQSRRAEHNPATANRVVIVPAAATLRSVQLGPGPQFFFHVLLNHRTYYLQLTGGPHPGCIGELIDGKPTHRSGALDHPPDEPTVRGDTFEGGIPFEAIHCPGTYRLHVSVARADGTPFPAFGSAAFTVRN